MRGVVTRLTRRIGFFPSGAAGRLQALFVVEAGQGKLADGLALLVAEGGEQHAVTVNVQAGDLAGGVAIGDRWVTVGGRVVLGDVAHVDGNPTRVGVRTVFGPHAVGHCARHPAGQLQGGAGSGARDNPGELAGTVEAQRRGDRRRRACAGRRRTVRVAAIDQGVGFQVLESVFTRY